MLFCPVLVLSVVFCTVVVAGTESETVSKLFQLDTGLLEDMFNNIGRDHITEEMTPSFRQLKMLTCTVCSTSDRLLQLQHSHSNILSLLHLLMVSLVAPQGILPHKGVPTHLTHKRLAAVWFQPLHLQDNSTKRREQQWTTK